MEKWVALLRGVNVGGANKVPMAKLRGLATGFGWQGVKTYIASGNLVFGAAGQAEALADTLRTGLARDMGVDVPVLVLPADTMQRALAGCPFTDADPARVYVYFLLGPPNLDTEMLATLKAEGEELFLTDHIAYFSAPEGVGRSKLGERMEKTLATSATARNLRTVAKLAAIAQNG